MRRFRVLGIVGLVALAMGFAAGVARGAEKGVRADQKKKLDALAEKYSKQWEVDRAAATKFAKERGLPRRRKLANGGGMQLIKVRNGRPFYYITHNLTAAKTVGADKLWPGGSLGLSLTGSGVTLGVWDEGKVLSTHQELVSRVTQKDSASTTSDHSTHVSGTMIATGVVSSAKGMSYLGTIDAYEWTDDTTEMATAAAAGLRASNHSYGYIAGWYYAGYWWYWYGDTSISTTEDYYFGFYDDTARDFDEIAYNAPDYLIIKSAGNDRGEGPTPGTPHYLASGGGIQYATRDYDGGDDGYDCLGDSSVSKNVLVVGAIEDIASGYSTSSDVGMSDFSSFGPTDDGRIKPDIVANGVGVYSCTDTSTTSYESWDGTSMASPNVAGTVGLLLDHFADNAGGLSVSPWASTVRGLIIHSANEAGSSTGPDYKFGWGLLNAEGAADTISKAVTHESAIEELTLNNSATYTLDVYAFGDEPLKVTICWTDPAGNPPSPALNPADKMLVNDLDLRVANGTTYYPWVLDPTNPANAATTADNNTDNVEQVLISSPTEGTHTITVNHKGSLQGGSQDFSLIVSGAVPSGYNVLNVRSSPLSGVPITGSVDDATNFRAIFVAGTSVSLVAPATGTYNGRPYELVYWRLDDVDQPDGQTTLDFTLNAHYTAEAVYVSTVAKYYILDGYGGVHSSDPELPSLSGGPFWSGWDIARGLSLVQDSSGDVKGGYVLDGYGGVHPVDGVSGFAGNPSWPGWDIAKAVCAVYDSTGDERGYYVLDGHGGVHAVGAVTPFTGGPSWSGWGIARDLAVVFDSTGVVQGYYVLDGYGGVRAVGGVPSFSGGPSWPGWDIARKLRVVFDGTGTVTGYYVLDGYGGVHAVGTVPSFTGGPSWSGWDIANGLGVAQDGAGTVDGYYIMDGWGGVHAVGDVREPAADPFWPSWDIARDIELVQGLNAAPTAAPPQVPAEAVTEEKPPAGRERTPTGAVGEESDSE